MIDLLRDCELFELTEDEPIQGFDCGDEDLNDFFNNDALLFREQLLGITSFFRHKETGQIVCAFSLSADSVKTHMLPGSRRKKVNALVPREKLLQSYPAFLIGRLAIATEFAGRGLGSQLMKFIKNHCSDQYAHFGRFLVVDAYNKPEVLNYYDKNGFTFVFSTDEQEREYLKKTGDTVEPLRTGQMYYDLKRYEL